MRPLYTALCRGKVTYFLVALLYLLRFSRFSVEVCNFLLITLRDTPQSVGLHWTRDRLDAEAST
jgi:hypothetical protein